MAGSGRIGSRSVGARRRRSRNPAAGRSAGCQGSGRPRRASSGLLWQTGRGSRTRARQRSASASSRVPSCGPAQYRPFGGSRQGPLPLQWCRGRSARGAQLLQHGRVGVAVGDEAAVELEAAHRVAGLGADAARRRRRRGARARKAASGPRRCSFRPSIVSAFGQAPRMGPPPRIRSPRWPTARA